MGVAQSRGREMNLSDTELIQRLVAFGAVAVLLGLPACIRAWKLWHAKKDPAANDSSYRQYNNGRW